MAEYCADGRFAVRRNVWIPQNQYRSVPERHIGWGGRFDGIETSAVSNKFSCVWVKPCFDCCDSEGTFGSHAEVHGVLYGTHCQSSIS